MIIVSKHDPKLVEECAIAYEGAYTDCKADLHGVKLCDGIEAVLDLLAEAEGECVNEVLRKAAAPVADAENVVRLVVHKVLGIVEEE